MRDLLKITSPFLVMLVILGLAWAGVSKHQAVEKGKPFMECLFSVTCED